MSDQYPSNSHASASPRPQRTKQTAIITNVHVRKKPWTVRIAERGSGIWKDVLFEVIGPYFRDMFADSGYRAIDGIFYNEGVSRRPNGPRPGRNQQQVTAAGYVVTDYNSQYTAGAPAPTHGSWTKPFDFSIYSFADYAAGREMIDRLNHLIGSYGHATVNDLYDLLSMSGDHTGENYGWDGVQSLAGAEVRRARGGGYFLDIPDAKPLRK